MKHLIPIICLFFLFNTCKDKAKPPTVITTQITEINAYYVIAGGEVIDDGGALLKARGLCVTTSQEDLPNCL